MGYFLLYESMLDTVLWARDQYLEVRGQMLPDFCRLYIAGVCDTEMYQQRCAFWDNVYGFRMSCMKSAVMSEVEIAVVDSTKVITEPFLIKVRLCHISSRRSVIVRVDFSVVLVKWHGVFFFLQCFDTVG